MIASAPPEVINGLTEARAAGRFLPSGKDIPFQAVRGLGANYCPTVQSLDKRNWRPDKTLYLFVLRHKGKAGRHLLHCLTDSACNAASIYISIIQ
jgi:hypothetical protein